MSRSQHHAALIKGSNRRKAISQRRKCPSIIGNSFAGLGVRPAEPPTFEMLEMRALLAAVPIDPPIDLTDTLGFAFSAAPASNGDALLVSGFSDFDSAEALSFLDPSGSPLGAPIPLDQRFTVGDIAFDAAGEFVVTGHDFDTGVIVQQFEADGSPKDGIIEVGAGDSPQVAVASTGAFAVVWPTSEVGGTVMGRLFAADGTPISDAMTISDPFSVPDQVPLFGQHPDVAITPDGTVIVSYIELRGGDELFPESAAVVFKRFDSQGSPVGDKTVVATRPAETLVMSEDEGYTGSALVDVDGQGNFWITADFAFWEGDPFDEEHTFRGSELFTQRYDSDGSAMGSRIIVASTTAQSGGIVSGTGNDSSRLDVDEAGRALFVWQESDSTGYAFDYRVNARLFGTVYDAAGNVVEPTFRIDDGSRTAAYDVKAAFIGDGRIAATFAADIDEDFNTAEFLRIFQTDLGANHRIGEGTGRSKIVLSDGAGNEYEFNYKGAGIAEVSRDDVGRFSVNVAGSSVASAMTIKPGKNNADNAIHSFTADGPMKSVAAKGVHFLGDIAIAGGIASFTGGNIADQHVVSFGGAPTDKPAKLVFDRLTDVTLTSGAPVDLTVINWIDSDPTVNPDSLTAPYATKITVKGDKKSLTPARWDADVNLSGQGATKQTLGNFKAETAGGAAFNITGDVGSIAFTGAVNDVGFAIQGTPGGKQALGKLTVGGNATNLAANITGNVGAIDLSKGVVNGLDLVTVNSELKTLKLGNVTQASVQADDVGAVSAVRWTAGELTAALVKSIAVTGNTKAGIPGDFHAGVLRAATFGKIDVKGNVTDAAILAGSTLDSVNAIASFKVGGNFTNSQVKVGVRPGVDGLFNTSDDDLDAAPDNLLKAVTIGGAVMPADQQVFFAGALPKSASINKQQVNPLESPLFGGTPMVVGVVESWRAAAARMYRPSDETETQPVFIAGDLGKWYISDTISEFPEDYDGPDPNFAEISGGKLTLHALGDDTSNLGGVAFNIWANLSRNPLNPQFDIAITAASVLSFDAGGQLVSPEPSIPHNNQLRDEVSLTLVNGTGQIVRYVLDRDPSAEPFIADRGPVIGGEIEGGWMDVFLDPEAGTYTVDLGQHFPLVDGFNPSDPASWTITGIVFEVTDTGTGTLDNLRIGTV